MNPRVRVCIAVGAVLALMAACDDRDPVGPPSSAELRRATAPRASDVLPPGDSPDLVSGETVSNSTGGAGPTVFLGYYPSKTLVVATATGRIFWTQDWGSTGSYGPAGWKDGSGLIRGSAWLWGGTINAAGGFSFGANISPWPGQWVDTASKVVWVKDSIKANREHSGISDPTRHHPWYCGGGYPGNPCISYEGTTKFTLERIFGDLQFAADSTNVYAGSTVNFKNQIVNVSVPGQNLRPYTSTKYVWIPADTSIGGSQTEVVDSSANACVKQAGDSTCTRVIQGSGTMRIVARVNGETQVREQYVDVGIMTTVEPDSACYEEGGSGWDNPPASAPEGPQYVAPPTVQRATFHLDFTDQHGEVHHFTLSNCTFRRVKIVKTTSRYVDAIYSWDKTVPCTVTSSPNVETLHWVSRIPVRSEMIETLPGSGSYSGPFYQNGKASGQFWRRL